MLAPVAPASATLQPGATGACPSLAPVHAGVDAAAAPDQDAAADVELVRPRQGELICASAAVWLLRRM